MWPTRLHLPLHSPGGVYDAAQVTLLYSLAGRTQKAFLVSMRGMGVFAPRRALTSGSLGGTAGLAIAAIPSDQFDRYHSRRFDDATGHCLEALFPHAVIPVQVTTPKEIGTA